MNYFLCEAKDRDGELPGPFPHVLILRLTSLQFIGDRKHASFKRNVIPSHKLWSQANGRHSVSICWMNILQNIIGDRYLCSIILIQQFQSLTLETALICSKDDWEIDIIKTFILGKQYKLSDYVIWTSFEQMLCWGIWERTPWITLQN